ncbi:hypothetical protein HS1genome_0557 [Sulfodiicoccus acidiphilus]|uniref:Carbon monoxide dehydrogenase n=1 Tax=Sulfodiicoccus acidiphilus TaxID=1670455 RepID=A0A348B1W6_9CREN|nr:SRPBCC domain-containing protein [Sulfodiicoccus acidiphilus]BBD72168.1 hypothetical protein HS1genome_0557 [Sulfodiicoccus acidiphilus]GGT94516.1 hypothetical protein GCM10007116_10140 [Sulfodiicoccus acidiphilus]
MKVEGKFEVEAPKDRVDSFLSDPNQFSQCLPGLREMKVETEGFRASFKLDVSGAGISQLSTVSSTMTFKVVRSAEGVSIRGEGKAVGAKVRLELNVRTLGTGSVTTVEWDASLDVGLLARFFGDELLRRVTDDNVRQLTSCVQAKVSSPS